jgi:predicted ABC-type ATPase
MSQQKKILIFAAPNGAGKTTFTREFLPFEADCPSFVNADLIAAGMAPLVVARDGQLTEAVVLLAHTGSPQTLRRWPTL